MTLIAVETEIVPADLDERPRAGESADETARRLAVGKACASTLDDADAILAADTVVVLDGELFGKPADAEQAAAMLRRLRGRWHTVITAVALRTANEVLRVREVGSAVRLRRFSDREIDVSVASGFPLDKAGAYGIQDERFRPVDNLDGCFSNVVGLPLCEVERLLEPLGVAASGDAVGAPERCNLCVRASRLSGIGGSWQLGPRD